MVSPRNYNFVLLFIAVTVALGIYTLCRRLAFSPHGRVLRAMRDNEPLALSLGKNIAKQRIITFVFVGGLYGLVAPLYIWYIRSILPSLFASHLTFTAWTALVVGGIASIGGPAIGAALLIALTEALLFIPVPPEYATLLSASRPFLLGIALIIVLRLRPEGLVPEQRSFEKQGASGKTRSRAEFIKGGRLVKPSAASMNSRDTPLVVNGVRKTFGGLVAVDDVSVTARQGQITALIGPNGAGKTTLFNIVTGFESADSGSIRLGDQDLSGLAPWRIARSGIVRTFQTPIGFPRLTVRENLLAAGCS